MSGTPSSPAAPETATGERLSLDGEMTIGRAVELKQALLGALGGRGPLDLDLGAVTDLDTAGVQLLLLARAVATARQKPFKVVAASPAVQQVLGLLDLAATLDLPPPAPSAEGEAG